MIHYAMGFRATSFVARSLSSHYSTRHAADEINVCVFCWYSQVPTCRLWARVSLALFEFFMTPKSDLIAPLTTMASHLDLDMKFSEA